MAPFVYQKKGNRGNVPCHQFTCDIQVCLSNNDYKQEKCEHLVDRLYECCRSFYARHPDITDVASCPEPKKLEEKLDARQAEKRQKSTS